MLSPEAPVAPAGKAAVARHPAAPVGRAEPPAWAVPERPAATAATGVLAVGAAPAASPTQPEISAAPAA
ncbi:hypothetical protein A5645_03090 [Mycobacterium asiaticum]|nr:hypothetical protein A5645_03090 [Mycobacterium asiaticum]